MEWEAIALLAGIIIASFTCFEIVIIWALIKINSDIKKVFEKLNEQAHQLHLMSQVHHLHMVSSDSLKEGKK